MPVPPRRYHLTVRHFPSRTPPPGRGYGCRQSRHSRQGVARGRFAGPLLTALALATALLIAPPAPVRGQATAGPATPAAPGTPASSPTPGNAAVPAAQPATPNPYGVVEPTAPPVDANPHPPDGKWLKDAQGRLYYLERVRKVEGNYRRIDDHTVRTVWGIPIDVAKE